MAVVVIGSVSAALLVGCTGSDEPDGSAATIPVELAPAGQVGVQVADPVRVRVPSVGIDAQIVPLYVDAAGELPAPEDFGTAGWWHDGPEPGEVGPSVIAGHVDSRKGPAVFYRLEDIRPGDQIVIDRADGSVVSFLARRVDEHPKNEFPTDAVYGATPDAQLRLITCGGDFDDDVRSYVDNVIVYATTN